MSRKSPISINSIISSPTNQIPTSKLKKTSASTRKRSTDSEKNSNNHLKNNQRTKLLTDPNKIVAVGSTMLNSSNWSDVIGGLVLMTGLKCSDILQTGIFEKHSKFSVMFSQLKNGQLQQWEIPTLTEADNVLKAIRELRNSIDTTRLDLKTINASYLPSVIKSCDSHFDLLIPNHQKNDNLYTHLYRSVYATIATYWYCPPSLDPIDYQAYIRGQVAALQLKINNSKLKNTS